MSRLGRLVPDRAGEMITKTDAGIHIDKWVGSWSTDRSREDLVSTHSLHR